jgi:hypothetical protein
MQTRQNKSNKKGVIMYIRAQIVYFGLSVSNQDIVTFEKINIRKKYLSDSFEKLATGN